MGLSFRAIAALLLPVDPRQDGVIIEADDTWRFDPAATAGADVAVWGHEALPSGTRRGRLLRSAMAREGALQRLRRRGPRGLPVVEVHRLPPPLLRGGGLRNRIREAALGGALVEMAAPHRPDRVLDAVGQAAGCPDRISEFRPGVGGTVLIRVTTEVHGRGFLRAALEGTSTDPAGAARALRTLEHAGIDPVPRILDAGTTSGASWSLETIMPGRRLDRLRPKIAQDCARFCASLPRSDGPAEAPRGDAAMIAGNFPHWAEALEAVHDRIEAAIGGGPAVARHGDLWAGNVLADRERLTGITDWDAWHPSAVPGADLLHLVVTDEALRTRVGIGSMLLTAPWTREGYRAVTQDYWAALGIQPDDTYLEGVGLAWWIGQVASSLSRIPDLARDEQWVQRNVDQVLAALAERPAPTE